MRETADVIYTIETPFMWKLKDSQSCKRKLYNQYHKTYYNMTMGTIKNMTETQSSVNVVLMMRSWIARLANEMILRKAGAERTLVKTIWRQELKFVGHILREHGLERDCLLVRVEGREREEDRVKFMDTFEHISSGPCQAGSGKKRMAFHGQ